VVEIRDGQILSSMSFKLTFLGYRNDVKLPAPAYRPRSRPRVGQAHPLNCAGTGQAGKVCYEGNFPVNREDIKPSAITVRGPKGKNLPRVQSSSPRLSKTSPATQDGLAKRVR
jgi:hypothetical protein